MPRKPKRIRVTEVIIENIELDDRLVEDVYESFEQEFGGFESYDNVRFSVESISEYPEDGLDIHIVGDRLETDQEYEKRVAKLQRKKANEKKVAEDKLKKINSQLARLEREKKKLEKVGAKSVTTGGSRLDSVN